ncbi:MAG: FAD-dependent oxidoreductase [Syntrophotaleaceae bacterium]
MDRTDGREYHFTAPVVINAAGPWCREVAALADRDRPRLFANRVLVWNLLFGRAPLASCAVAVRPRRPGAHTYFLPPWKGQLLIGTGHVPLAPGEHRPPSGEEVAAMIDDVNEAVPAWNSDRESCGGSITGSCRERAVFGWPADRYWSITVPSRGRRGCTACRESVTTARQVADRITGNGSIPNVPQPMTEKFAPSNLHGVRGLGLSPTIFKGWQELLEKRSPL